MALAKVPGESMGTKAVPLSFLYEHSLGEQRDAYERLLVDATQGRQALFARQDGVEECWRIVEPALTTSRHVALYARGTWGPAAADDLVAGAGRWHVPEAPR